MERFKKALFEPHVHTCFDEKGRPFFKKIPPEVFAEVVHPMLAWKHLPPSQAPSRIHGAIIPGTKAITPRDLKDNALLVAKLLNLHDLTYVSEVFYFLEDKYVCTLLSLTTPETLEKLLQSAIPSVRGKIARCIIQNYMSSPYDFSPVKDKAIHNLIQSFCVTLSSEEMGLFLKSAIGNHFCPEVLKIRAGRILNYVLHDEDYVQVDYTHDGPHDLRTQNLLTENLVSLLKDLDFNQIAALLYHQDDEITQHVLKVIYEENPKKCGYVLEEMIQMYPEKGIMCVGDRVNQFISTLSQDLTQYPPVLASVILARRSHQVGNLEYLLESMKKLEDSLTHASVPDRAFQILAYSKDSDKIFTFGYRTKYKEIRRLAKEIDKNLEENIFWSRQAHQKCISLLRSMPQSLALLNISISMSLDTHKDPSFKHIQNFDHTLFIEEIIFPILGDFFPEIKDIFKDLVRPFPRPEKDTYMGYARRIAQTLEEKKYTLLQAACFISFFEGYLLPGQSLNFLIMNHIEDKFWMVKVLEMKWAIFKGLNGYAHTFYSSYYHAELFSHIFPSTLNPCLLHRACTGIALFKVSKSLFRESLTCWLSKKDCESLPHFFKLLFTRAKKLDGNDAEEAISYVRDVLKNLKMDASFLSLI